MKTIVVTGANRGIGLAITRSLLHQHHRVIAVVRSEAAAEKLKSKFASEKTTPDIVTGDLGCAGAIEAIAHQIGSLISSIDVLINNAGIIGSATVISATPLEEMEEVHRVNVMAPFQLTNALLPFLRKSADARIINMSSGMGALTDLDGSYGAYRMSKAGLNLLTLMQAGALMKEGIHVYSVCPGWVKTDMGGSAAPRTPEQGADTPVWLATCQPSQASGKFYRDRNIISF